MKAATEAGGKVSVHRIHMQEEGHQTDKKKGKINVKNKIKALEADDIKTT